MSSPPSAPIVGANKPSATTPKRAKNRSMDVSDLLNFTLPPRQAQVQHVLPRRSKKAATTYGVWNKEKFVNAQYRFVMKPTGDYTVHFADPDIFFQWEDILQVIIPRTSALAAASGKQFEQKGQDEGQITCPICLSPPSAPRMTKCGHVFCFPCILHYLDTSKQAKWHRCPICFDSVNEKQLKAVTWLDEGSTLTVDTMMVDDAITAMDSVPKPGSTLRMRLMHRPQITTLALPRSHTWPSDALPPHQAPFHFLPDVYRFARFMLATPSYLLESLSRDLDELEGERRLFASSDMMTHGFLDKAEDKVRVQMAKAASLETDEVKEAISRAEQDVKEIELRVETNERKLAERDKREIEVTDQLESIDKDVPEDFLATQQYGLSSITQVVPASVPKPILIPTPTRDRRQRRNINPPPPSTSTYYYYQAASGAPIFLHPLDIRILLAHFHTYPSFPDTITVRVDAVAEGSVNDDLKKRCKYLGHVPESADVVFVETDLIDVVGADGLKNFEGLLKTRTAKRKEKDRKDERARVRAEEREKEKIVRPVVTMSDTSASPAPNLRSPSPEPPLISPTLVTTQSSLPSQPPAASGVWGHRSFASALHSPSTSRPTPPTARVSVRGGGTPAQGFSIRDSEQDEWEMDAAWHELERGVVPGGRKKRGNKLVLLGGAGARRR